MSAVRVLLLFCTLSLLFSGAFAYGCCCNIDGGIFIQQPPDVTMECLVANDYGNAQLTEFYAGYGYYGDWCFTTCVCNVNQPCSGITGTPGVTGTLTRVTAPYPSNTCTFGNTVYATRQFCHDGCCATQNIYLVDTIAPELVIPSDVTIECTGQEPDNVNLDSLFGSARSTDLCTFPTLTSAVTVTNPNACTTEFTRAFTSYDGCYKSTGTQHGYIVDTTPPVLFSNLYAVEYFSCDQTAAFSAAIPANQPSASDACNLGNNPTTNVDILYPGKCAGDYTIERTWSRADFCGNVGQLVQIIVVEDNLPPTVTPTPTSTFTNVSCTVPNPTAYTVKDSCVGNEAYLTYEELQSGIVDFESRYDVIRSYVASDSCGNTLSWQNVYAVHLDADVSLTNLGTDTITEAKGATFTISYQLSTVTLCKQAYVVFDIGAAQFLSSSPTCTGATGGGAVYCPVGPYTVATLLTISLTLQVPTTYAPNFLEIRVSFQEDFSYYETVNYVPDNRIIIKLT